MSLVPIDGTGNDISQLKDSLNTSNANQLVVDSVQDTNISNLQTSQGVLSTRVDINEATINTLAANQLVVDTNQNTAISNLQTSQVNQAFELQTLNSSQATQNTNIGILQAKTVRQDVSALWTEPVEPVNPNSNSIGTGLKPWGNVYSADVTATNLRSNIWRNSTDTAGVSLTDSVAGSVTLNGTDYTGTANNLLNVDATGLVRKTHVQATMSQAGVLECKSITTQSITGNASGPNADLDIIKEPSR